MVVLGVCSPLALVWLVGGRSFLAFGVRSAFVRCMAWMWLAFMRLAFVRLWFWRGWLVEAFACLWCPRACLLGMWLASVCFGSVAAAGLVGSCQGLGYPCPSQCVGRYASLEEFTASVGEAR